MIIHSLNICSSSPSPSKTDQIMSRYRPIAPKPQLPVLNPLLKSPSTPDLTQNSALFRPTRSRKRSKVGTTPAAASHKRAKTHVPELSSPCIASSLVNNTQLGPSMQAFAPGFPGFPIPSFGFNGSLEKPVTTSTNLVTLPLLSYPSSVPVVDGGLSPYPRFEATVLGSNHKAEIPQEMDLLQNLHATITNRSSNLGSGNLITPQPMRPIGSSISVGCISEDSNSGSTACVSKRAEEVEAEVESEALPAVISDSSNRVRLVNSAYKEMVGQPECLWLDSMDTHEGQSRSNTCKRIGGEVMLDLPASTMPVSSNGFSCRVRIEWARNGQKSFVSAPCDVNRLLCESKDYLFTWRFHTSEAIESKIKA